MKAIINPALAQMAMNVDQLHEDPANARKHPKKNIEALKHSLATFGMQKPLVVLADGTVIAGNGQLRAAKALGWEQVPVVVFQDRAKAKAYAIADNRTAELAEWDDDILADTLAELGPLDGMGFENDELVSLGVLEPALLPLDEAPERPKTPTLKTGQLFALGRHRLLCGDSTRAESCAKLMNGEQAKLIFTDPPYGVAYGSKTIGAGNPEHKAIANDSDIDTAASVLQAALTNALNMTTQDCSIYVTGPTGDGLAPLLRAVDNAGWQHKHLLVWVKNSIVLGRADYYYKHEGIYYGWRKDGTHKFYGENQNTVWEFDRPSVSKLHPTMKPIELIVKAIGNSSQPQDIVLDLFLGSGSTLMACEATGRVCYGMELDPGYCEVIIKRWEEHTGLKAKPISD